MPSILPPRAKTEYRLLCSECRRRNGSKDDGLVCLFEEYTQPPDEKLMDVHLELREREGVLERREPGEKWTPYGGNVVLCVGCYRSSGGQDFVVFNPHSKLEVGP